MGRESLHSEYSERIAAELRAQKARLNLTFLELSERSGQTQGTLTCSPRLKPGDSCFVRWLPLPIRKRPAPSQDDAGLLCVFDWLARWLTSGPIRGCLARKSSRYS